MFLIVKRITIDINRETPIEHIVSIFEYIKTTECDNSNDRLAIPRKLFCDLAIDILENLASISQLECTFNGLK